jgi:hypothetical protein
MVSSHVCSPLLLGALRWLLGIVHLSWPKRPVGALEPEDACGGLHGARLIAMAIPLGRGLPLVVAAAEDLGLCVLQSCLEHAFCGQGLGGADRQEWSPGGRGRHGARGPSERPGCRRLGGGQGGGRQESPVLPTEDSGEVGVCAQERQCGPGALEAVRREEAQTAGAEAPGGWGEASAVVAVLAVGLQRLGRDAVGGFGGARRQQPDWPDIFSTLSILDAEYSCPYVRNCNRSSNKGANIALHLTAYSAHSCLERPLRSRFRARLRPGVGLAASSA